VAAVCVFCSGQDDLPGGYLELAREAGRRIAERGHTLVFGGGRSGMMGALADAARAAGATTVGIIPESLKAAERSDPACDELIVTPDLAGRKILMIEKADGFLVLPGGLGTLDELFEVWTTGPQLGLHTKPIAVVNADGYYDGLLGWLRDVVRRGLIRERLLDVLTVAGTVDAALDRMAA